jgi:hypothetical protein
MPAASPFARLTFLCVLGAGSLGPLAVGRAEDPPPPAPAAPAHVYVGTQALEARLADLLARAQRAGVPLERTAYGRSQAGRPLHALWFGERGRRPLVLVHGGLGANDAAGVVAVLDLAERLLGEEGREPLARVGFVLLPAPNPDALDAFLAGQPRAGGVPVDRDRDGTAAEDGPDDVDGDGEVRRMRRRSLRGTWAAGREVGREGTPERDARLLLERGVDASRGESYELFVEGLDQDGDGRVGEDPPGLDLTRGLAGTWDHQGPWGGDGDYPGQAPEARALLDLSFELPNLLAWYGFRSEGPFLLRASEHGALADADNALYDKVGAALEQRTSVGVRRAAERAGGRNPGSDLDWASAHLGALAFAVPIWRIARQPEHKAERGEPDELDWLLWNDATLGGKGFQPWTPFAHPTLGAVEVGGWARFTRHEPPAERLGEAVRAVSAAPLVHAAFVPSLAIEVTTETRGAGLFEVRARVRNAGSAPTETPLAQARRRAHPVRLTLRPADGAERLAGPAAFDAGVLAAGASSGEARWLLRRPSARPAGSVLGTLRATHRLCPEQSVEVQAR